MSDTPRLDPQGRGVDEHPVLATIRHAPRFARLVVTGAGIGALFGVAVGLGLPGNGAQYVGVVCVLTALAFAVIGGLIVGAVATRYDAASVWQANEQRRALEGASVPYLEALLRTPTSGSLPSLDGPLTDELPVVAKAPKPRATPVKRATTRRTTPGAS